MPFTVYLPLLGAILILQTTIMENFSVAGIKPDLVMLVVVLNGFLLGTKEGAFLGFAGGIIEDLFTGNYIGLNALSKMVAGYLAGTAGERLYRENVLVAAAVTFIASLAGLTVNYLLLLYLDIFISPLFAYYRIAIPGAVYTALLAPFVFWRISRYIQVRGREL